MSVKTIDAIRRILKIFETSEGALRPHFIVTGPSGSGKSHTIQCLAEEMANILDNSKLLSSYLTLFPGVEKEKVTTVIMKILADNYEKNTIGVRMINTLIHQYFIEGGIKDKEAKKTSFQKTLTL